MEEYDEMLQDPDIELCQHQSIVRYGLWRFRRNRKILKKLWNWRWKF